MRIFALNLQRIPCISNGKLEEAKGRERSSFHIVNQREIKRQLARACVNLACLTAIISQNLFTPQGANLPSAPASLTLTFPSRACVFVTQSKGCSPPFFCIFLLAEKNA